jgi:hypothetical protein
VTLTCRAKSSLVVPMYPERKSVKSWTFVDKCVRMFFGNFDAVRRAFESAVSKLAPVCKKYGHQLAVYSESESCD